MTTLETDRIILRMFTLDDLDALDAIFSNGNVMRYLGLHGAPMSRMETETALISIIKHWERHDFGRWAVISKSDGKLIGCAGIRNYEGIAELVYLLDEPYWGNGLATEIAFACLDFGFEKRDFEKIIAFARPQNTVSQKIMKKLGMSFVGEKVIFGITVVEYELLKDDYHRNQKKAASSEC